MSLLSCSSDDSATQSNQDVDRVVIQTEDWASKLSTATLTWLPIQLDDDRGQAAKLVAQDSGQWSDSGLPTLTYEINFNHTGSYLLNVHGRQDSAYYSQAEKQALITFGSDDGEITHAINGFDDQWQWRSTDIHGQQMNIEVKTPGVHLFKVASASTGISLEQISISRIAENTQTDTAEFHDDASPTDQTDLPSDTAGNTNQPPSVFIDGPTQATANTAVSLKAIATDDGKPHGAIYYYWSKISGPGNVSFTDQQSRATGLIFDTSGHYSVQVSANDGERYHNAVYSVVVSESSENPTTDNTATQNIIGNQAPTITPINTIEASTGQAVSVKSHATDDGLPHGGMYYFWSKISGPGSVIFSAQNASETQLTFNSAGSYRIQLNVNDGELYNNSEFLVSVTNNTTHTPDTTNLNGTWKKQVTSGQVSARHETGGVTVNGKLYVIGGRGSRPVDVYDPATNQWKTVANAPMEMHHFQPVAIGSKIYIVGAFTCCYPEEKVVDNVYVFDTATNQWSKKPGMPAQRKRGGAGAAVYNGRIYLLGGNTKGHSGGAVNWFDEYNPATNKWTALANAPDARDHVTIAISGTQLVAAGGRKSAYPQTFHNTVSRTNIYDFTSKKWKNAANIPTPRAGAMTVSTGPEVIVIGGESAASVKAHNNVEAYNVVTRKWRKLKPLTVGRHSGVAALLDGFIHVVTGGEGRGGAGESTVHEVLH